MQDHLSIKSLTMKVTLPNVPDSTKDKLHVNFRMIHFVVIVDLKFLIRIAHKGVRCTRAGPTDNEEVLLAANDFLMLLLEYANLKARTLLSGFALG